MSRSSVLIQAKSDQDQRQVKFLDLAKSNELIANELNDGIQRVMRSGAFAGGKFVEAFERRFADFCSCRYASGVGSGTDAIWLALLALGAGPGDEVITVPNTFFATAEAISLTGARPVFVDVDERTYTMDPNALEEAITAKTRGIIPVHLYGQMAPMKEIMQIAERHGLWVVEDASQAHGAEQAMQMAGSVGHAGCFSFYPTKNLGACGEAGAVVTNDPEIDRAVKVLRDHGQGMKHHHEARGWNARMDGLQAEILRVKLRHLPKWTERRRDAAELYNAALSGIEGITTPQIGEANTHVYHLYVIDARARAAIEEKFRERNIGYAVHYPTPIHLQDAYRDLGYGPGSFPVAERLAHRILSLPMYPGIGGDEIEAVADAIREARTSA